MLVNDDSSSWSQITDPGTNFLDDAHRFVAGDAVRAVSDLISALPVYVQIAPAYG